MNTTESPRFKVQTLANGRCSVMDVEVGKNVKFSYSNPPKYGNEEWGNYYSALGFSQKLHKKNEK